MWLSFHADLSAVLIVKWEQIVVYRIGNFAGKILERAISASWLSLLRITRHVRVLLFKYICLPKFCSRTCCSK